MQLQWLGQIVCPPGTLPDPTGRFCVNPLSPFPEAMQAPPLPPTPAITVPVVTVTPAGASEKEPNRTLLYAATIVGVGIITAVVLSKVVS
jgi:hypothetical protein